MKSRLLVRLVSLVMGLLLVAVLIWGVGMLRRKTEKPASTAAKKTTAAKTTEEIKLTAAEKRILTLYRAASAAVRKDAEAVLKGEKQVQEEGGNPLMERLLGGALDVLANLGKK